MKKLFTSLLICTLTICALSQAPEKMSYQAVIRNSSDQLVTNQKIGMRISILQGSVKGTAVYVETQTDTTNSNGLLSIEIGGGTVESGSFDAIDWANVPYFLKTETDPSGGTDYTIAGTSQLLSVPYALYATTAEFLSGGIIETQNLNDVLTQNDSAGYKNITNLANPVNAQDAATKAYVDELKSRVITMEDILINAGLYAITDADGNKYSVIKIGTQLWIAENLKTTKYNDGIAIPMVTDSSAWINLSGPGYCWFNNDSATYAQTYGALYNWFSVGTGRLCPTGWHVPTDEEWTILTNYLGGVDIAGGKLKEIDTTHWYSPNMGATNESGFTALPGGNRFCLGGFFGIGSIGCWWSATENGNYIAWKRNIYCNSGKVYRHIDDERSGFSIRCVRDF